MRWLIASGICLALTTSVMPQCRAQQAATPVDGRPQTFRSRSFILHTDLSADESKELLERLETMLRLISAYWGQPNKQVIEMYVAQDITNWPGDVLGQMDPDGVDQIRIGAGVTTGRTRIVGANRFTKSVVYACADHGTPQHEAVHAYCQQTFGTCGPLWYAEGMAEMGQYWKKDDSSVNCSDNVLRYLKKTQPKSLNEIINPQQEFTGDSWENYAWRWALCHLLANNPNYSPRFRPLGLGLLTERDVSFEKTYGSMAEEIIFEYLFFLNHMEPGYRVDLCAWDWKGTFETARRTNTIRSEIEAARGWQPTRARVEAGKEYDFSAAGTWRLDPKGDAVTADGDASGQGRLVGVLFEDYKLSEPFELGVYGTFTAPGSGDLYVRCRDDWGRLADNDGSVELKIKERDPQRPLPKPENPQTVAGRSDPDPKVSESEPKDAPSANDDKALRKARTKIKFGKLLLRSNKDKAREYFEAAIELAPDSKAAAEARQLLDAL